MDTDTSLKDGQETRGTDRVIIALIIVVILLSAAIAVMVFDDLGILEPPYPSEDTPLELVDGEIMWTGELDHWMNDSQTFDYRNLRLHWLVGDTGRHTTDELANYTQLSVGSLVTVTRPLIVEYRVDGITYHDVQEIHVTDLLGDGLFGQGDSIAFDFAEYGIPEDTIHTVALADIVCEWNRELSFAIHDGDFYSWESDDLPSDYPWWVY
ncbi:MAG TPA: hypothetical protein VMW71_00055 [Thermoplasmata archaeon]|nr:hypothetical protein [Thermoplasmata archaeon]